MLKGESRRPLCSGELESWRVGEQVVVFISGLVPGGRDREERMQSSIGKNLGSASEE